VEKGSLEGKGKRNIQELLKKNSKHSRWLIKKGEKQLGELRIQFSALFSS